MSFYMADLVSPHIFGKTVVSVVFVVFVVVVGTETAANKTSEWFDEATGISGVIRCE